MTTHHHSLRFSLRTKQDREKAACLLGIFLGTIVILGALDIGIPFTRSHYIGFTKGRYAALQIDKVREIIATRQPSEEALNCIADVTHKRLSADADLIKHQGMLVMDLLLGWILFGIVIIRIAFGRYKELKAGENHDDPSSQSV